MVRGAAALPQANTLESTFGVPIKQYPDYWATAVEYKERHLFERHQKGWGAAHTTPAPASVPFIAASHPFTGRRSSSC